MAFIAPLPRLEGVVELMDRPGNSEGEVRGGLRDLALLNRYFGGVRAVLSHLRRMIGARPETSIAILDVATGAADIPRAICRWARRRGITVAIEAVDRSEQVVAAATGWSVGYPEIRLRRAEVPSLPYPDGSFDYAITSLFLHHLTESQGVHLLEEMGRVARRGIIVTDLLRSRTARRLTATVTHLVTTNRLTRHDGPVSILRGFRPEELRRMAARAGLPDARVCPHRFFRVALVHEIQPPARERDAGP